MRNVIAPRRNCAAILASSLGSLFLVISPSARAGSGIWTNLAGGLWGTSTNWSGGNIASGTGAIADFSTLNLTSDAAIHLNAPVSVGTLNFGDSTPSNNWTLDNNSSAANILTLDDPFQPVINVVNQKVSINLVLAGAGGLAKVGVGTLTLNTSATYSGLTSIDQGVIQSGVINALPVTTTLSISPGASFDLAGHDQQVASILLLGPVTNSSATPAVFSINLTGSNSGNANITGNLSFTKTGPGTLGLSSSTTYAGNTLIQSGTLVSGAANVLPPTTNLTVNSGAVFDLAGFTQSFASISGGGTITNSNAVTPSSLMLAVASPSSTSTFLTGNIALSKTGGAALALDSPASVTGATLITAGLFQLNAAGNSFAAISGQGGLLVNTAATLTSDAIQLQSLTVAGSAVLRNAGGTSKLSTLLITHSGSVYTGVLNLANNKLIIQTSGSTGKATAISDINAAITAGFNGGSWNGNGLTSSTAALDAAHYGIGVFDNAILLRSSFGGQPTDTSSVLITVAHLGDANDNGIVDIQDLTIVANNWQLSRNTWALGDLNRSGIVDIQDFTIVANNWQQTGSFFQQPSFLAGQSLAPVPEPASLAVLALMVPLLINRARRPSASPHAPISLD